MLFIIGYFIIHSVEEVAKANKIKTEFVSVASHQLKTPISEMRWEIELLLSKFSSGMTSKQIEIIKEISRAEQKMGRMVNDLLDVAHIDRGQLAMSKDRMDICALVREAVDGQRTFAEANNVELHLSCPGGKIDVNADRKRMAVVLDNLISNAIKYIDKKGLVEVFIEKQDEFDLF